MKHTKGPWIATDDYDVRQQKTGNIICIFEDSASSCFDENNARLIAAAPDMLDALVEEYVVIDNIFHSKSFLCGEPLNKMILQTIEKKKKAIERATGMSIDDVLNEYENQ